MEGRLLLGEPSVRAWQHDLRKAAGSCSKTSLLALFTGSCRHSNDLHHHSAHPCPSSTCNNINVVMYRRQVWRADGTGQGRTDVG